MVDIIPQDTPTKQCYRCREIKPRSLAYFYSNRAMRDGLTPDCKVCLQADYRKLHPLVEKPPVIRKEFRECLSCKQVKPLTKEFFHVMNTAKGIFFPRCKDCRNQTARHHVPPGYKQCTKCQKVLLANSENFTKAANERYGLNSLCITCKKIKYQEDVVINPHSFPQEGTMKQCSQCKAVYPATLAFFTSDRSKSDHLRGECKKCGKAARRQEPRTEAFYLKKREQWRNFYYKNIVRERKRQNAGGDKRRASKLEIGGCYTAHDVQVQYANQKGKCYYCHKKLSKYHVDHVVPLSKGGSNDPSNLVIACPHCNLKKSAKLPHDFFEGGRLM